MLYEDDAVVALNKPAETVRRCLRMTPLPHPPCPFFLQN